jgi:acyl carrier protein
MDASRKALIKSAIAAELRLPEEVLDDAATVASVGLDSLGLAQSVVAVEGALGTEIDTTVLSEQLAPEMTLGQLVEIIESSLMDAPAAALG